MTRRKIPTQAGHQTLVFQAVVGHSVLTVLSVMLGQSPATTQSWLISGTVMRSHLLPNTTWSRRAFAIRAAGFMRSAPSVWWRLLGRVKREGGKTFCCSALRSQLRLVYTKDWPESSYYWSHVLLCNFIAGMYGQATSHVLLKGVDSTWDVCGIVKRETTRVIESGLIQFHYMNSVHRIFCFPLLRTKY